METIKSIPFLQSKAWQLGPSLLILLGIAVFVSVRELVSKEKEAQRS